jgi:HSP20 family protein
MAITLWKSRPPFEGLMRWFENEDFFARAFDKSLLPSLDVKEKSGKYLLKADLPGLKKKDIHIEVSDGMLTLWGEHREEHEEKKGRLRRTEQTYGCFERSIRVPEGVTEKDIHAKYSKGVLELSIPAPKARERKAIAGKVK